MLKTKIGRHIIFGYLRVLITSLAICYIMYKVTIHPSSNEHPLFKQVSQWALIIHCAVAIAYFNLVEVNKKLEELIKSEP